MATSSSSADIPFSVQGFVTDPKLVGFQVLTNYESMYWRALVGNDAWSLYEVLRSFCHAGNDTCRPSIRLLAATLGLKEKRVLTGWTKTLNGKVYHYPGLIEILQQHNLVIAEVQGESPKTHYIFHIHLTPGLLTDAQLQQIPAILQKKHAELLVRCQKEQEALQAKRRPPKQPKGGGKLPPGGGKLPPGGGNLPPEQHPLDNTHRTTSSAKITNNNNSGGQPAPKAAVVVAFSPPVQQEALETLPHQTDPEPPLALPTSSATEAPIPLDPPSPATANQAAEQALLAIGIGQKAAQRLATRYRAERIAEKLEFLAFLQQERPATVQNPRGWLRRAIEEDYGPPDGFISPAVRAAKEVERQRQEAGLEQLALAQHQQEVAERERQQQEAADRLAHWYQTYGTTQREIDLWVQFLHAFQYALPSATFLGYVTDTVLLSLQEGEAVIGLPNQHARDWVTNRFSKKIERVLSSYLGSQKVAVTFVDLAAADASRAQQVSPGEDGATAPTA